MISGVALIYRRDHSMTSLSREMIAMKKQATQRKPAATMYNIGFSRNDKTGKEMETVLKCDKIGDHLDCGIYDGETRIKRIVEPISSITSNSIDSVTITNDGNRFVLEPNTDYGMKCMVEGGKGEDNRLKCEEGDES
jgi:hypothetical protein